MPEIDRSSSPPRCCSGRPHKTSTTEGTAVYRAHRQSSRSVHAGQKGKGQVLAASCTCQALSAQLPRVHKAGVAAEWSHAPEGAATHHGRGAVITDFVSVQTALGHPGLASCNTALCTCCKRMHPRARWYGRPQVQPFKPQPVLRAHQAAGNFSKYATRELTTPLMLAWPCSSSQPASLLLMYTLRPRHCPHPLKLTCPLYAPARCRLRRMHGPPSQASAPAALAFARSTRPLHPKLPS